MCISIKQYFNKTLIYFYGKSISMSQKDNRKYTYISVLSFKTFARSCFSMYQLYFSIYRLVHPKG